MSVKLPILINSDIALSGAEITLTNKQGQHLAQTLCNGISEVIKLVPKLADKATIAPQIRFVKTASPTIFRVDIDENGKVVVTFAGKVVLPFVNKDHRFFIQTLADGSKRLDVVAEKYPGTVQCQLQILLLHFLPMLHQTVMLETVTQEEYFETVARLNVADKLQTFTMLASCVDAFAEAQIKINVSGFSDVRGESKRKADDASQQVKKTRLAEPPKASEKTNDVPSSSAKAPVSSSSKALFDKASALLDEQVK